jgi:hypothetical protein
MKRARGPSGRKNNFKKPRVAKSTKKYVEERLRNVVADPKVVFSGGSIPSVTGVIDPSDARAYNVWQVTKFLNLDGETLNNSTYRTCVIPFWLDSSTSLAGASGSTTKIKNLTAHLSMFRIDISQALAADHHRPYPFTRMRAVIVQDMKPETVSATCPSVSKLFRSPVGFVDNPEQLFYTRNGRFKILWDSKKARFSKSELAMAMEVDKFTKIDNEPVLLGATNDVSYTDSTPALIDEITVGREMHFNRRDAMTVKVSAAQKKIEPIQWKRSGTNLTHEYISGQPLLVLIMDDRQNAEDASTMAVGTQFSTRTVLDV